MDSSRSYVVISSGWHLDASSLAGFLIPGVAIPLVLLVLAFLQPTRRQMERWAAVCGVTLTETNREQVRTHLARGRRFRSVAAFPFWWMASISLIYAPFPRYLATPLPAIAMYLAGALLAEVTGGRVRTAATAERRAPLMTRSMADYAPRWIRTLPWALVAVGVATVVLARVFETSGSTARGPLVVALATLLAVGAELAGHSIVRRPQRGSEPDALATDDGLRATGISTAHAAAALGGIWAAWTGVGEVVPDTGWGWWLLLFVTPVWLAAYGMTIGLLTLVVRQETWGYRRRHRQARATAASAVSA